MFIHGPRNYLPLIKKICDNRSLANRYESENAKEKQGKQIKNDRYGISV